MNRESPARRELILTIALALLGALPCGARGSPSEPPPNVVIIFADDLGYGDLGCYGHPTIPTPNLDRMAAEGQRFTDFYSAAPVCTPSRAALLTGRLPIRSGMCDDAAACCSPTRPAGCRPRRSPWPRPSRTRGYATACVGKWHLGRLPAVPADAARFRRVLRPALLQRHGRRVGLARRAAQPLEPQGRRTGTCPLIRERGDIERPADQTTLTPRYTERRSASSASTTPGRSSSTWPTPSPRAAVSPRRSSGPEPARALRRRGRGDRLERRARSSRRCATGLGRPTLVFFTSDNGPWLIFDEHGGSAGPAPRRQGHHLGGGMREPGIAWWPGTQTSGG